MDNIRKSSKLSAHEASFKVFEEQSSADFCGQTEISFDEKESATDIELDVNSTTNNEDPTWSFWKQVVDSKKEALDKWKLENSKLEAEIDQVRTKIEESTEAYKTLFASAAQHLEGNSEDDEASEN